MEKVVQNKGKKNETTTTEARALVRAKLGREKISTVVRPRDKARFRVLYKEVFRNNITTLSKHRR